MILRVASRKLLLAAVIALGLGLAMASSQLAPGAFRGVLDRALTWAAMTGGWGAFLLVVMQIAIAVSGLVPASLLGLAAGAIYGVPTGFAISAGGTMIGAFIAFHLARSLFRAQIEQHLSKRPRLRRIDSRVGRENWKLVCLMRVSPVMPFAITSYALGLSSISAVSFMLGSLCSLPALLGYVLLGSIAHVGLEGDQIGAPPYRWLILGAGAVATIVLTAKVGQLVRLALSDCDADRDEGAPTEA